MFMFEHGPPRDQSPEASQPSRLNRLVGAVATLVLASTLNSCSAEAEPVTYEPAESSAVITPSSETTPSRTAASETPAGYNTFDTRELLEANAGIHMIYIPVENAAPADSDGDPVMKAISETYRKNILEGDEAFTQEIQDGISEATYGRYNPAVEVTIAKQSIRLDDGCVDRESNRDVLKIYDVVTSTQSEHSIPSIPVAVVDAPSCTGKEAVAFAGFNHALVITNTAFGIHFRRALIHELGHSGGLDHAGVAACTNAVKVSDCEINPTLDQNSMMGYRDRLAGMYDTPKHNLLKFFTPPELYELGLLREDEVITLNTAQMVEYAEQNKQITLSAIDTAGHKLLALETENPNNELGDRVFISWGPDPYAALYDKYCETDRLCDKTGSSTGDKSLQVRVPTITLSDGDITGTFALVGFPINDRMSDLPRLRGFNRTGVVHEANNVQLVLTEHDGSSATLSFRLTKEQNTQPRAA
ncbi:hypothetical protein CSA80_01360 [Candidatus Saccharibacteria bacterium]|nr:MAG: hypothetical protein CSA80_01360 [Candidatus Saccharibacteria bacterium]